MHILSRKSWYSMQTKSWWWVIRKTCVYLKSQKSYPREIYMFYHYYHYVLPTSVTFAIQWHLLVHVPGFALQITVIWLSTGPMPWATVLGVSAALLWPSRTNFSHTFEMRQSVVNNVHDGWRLTCLCVPTHWRLICEHMPNRHWELDLLTENDSLLLKMYCLQRDTIMHGHETAQFKYFGNKQHHQ